MSELSRLNYTQEMFSFSMETDSPKQGRHKLYLQPHDDSCKPEPRPSTQELYGHQTPLLPLSDGDLLPIVLNQSLPLLPAPKFSLEGKHAASCGKVLMGPLQEEGEKEEAEGLQIGKFEVLHTAAAQQSFIHC